MKFCGQEQDDSNTVFRNGLHRHALTQAMHSPLAKHLIRLRGNCCRFRRPLGFGVEHPQHYQRLCPAQRCAPTPPIPKSTAVSRGQWRWKFSRKIHLSPAMPWIHPFHVSTPLVQGLQVLQVQDVAR